MSRVGDLPDVDSWGEGKVIKERVRLLPAPSLKVPGLSPDRCFRKFRASGSGDRRILRCSGPSCDGFQGCLKLWKGRAGRLSVNLKWIAALGPLIGASSVQSVGQVFTTQSKQGRYDISCTGKKWRSRKRTTTFSPFFLLVHCSPRDSKLSIVISISGKLFCSLLTRVAELVSRFTDIIVSISKEARGRRIYVASREYACLLGSIFIFILFSP